ncbi:MAG: DUF2807 domain-containing protein [Archangium sp.]
MNHALLKSALILSLSTLSACQLATGSGNVVSENREVSSFRKVDVADGITLHATTGSRALKLTADDNLMPLIQTFVTGDTLHIQLKPTTVAPVLSTLTADVSNDLFEGLDASGGCLVDVAATSTDDFPITASGGSDVTITGLATNTVTMDASGGSTITLSGTAVSGTASSSGGSGLKLRGLPMQRLAVDASGGATVVARVSSSLTGSASGGSTVSIIGTPSSRLDVSGGSQLNLNVE